LLYLKTETCEGRNIFRQYSFFIFPFFFLSLPTVHFAVLYTAMYQQDPLLIYLTNRQPICKPFYTYDLYSSLQKRDRPEHNMAYRLCFMQLYAQRLEDMPNSWWTRM